MTTRTMKQVTAVSMTSIFGTLLLATPALAQDKTQDATADVMAKVSVDSKVDVQAEPKTDDMLSEEKTSELTPFETADADANASLSPTEFEAYVTAMAKSGDARYEDMQATSDVALAFVRLDANADGEVSKDELGLI